MLLDTYFQTYIQSEYVIEIDQPDIHEFVQSTVAMGLLAQPSVTLISRSIPGDNKRKLYRLTIREEDDLIVLKLKYPTFKVIGKLYSHTIKETLEEMGISRNNVHDIIDVMKGTFIEHPNTHVMVD